MSAPTRSIVRAVGFALVTVLASSPAFAAGWQEVHQTSDDVRVTVGADGVATFEHHLRYRVVAGRFKAFELAGIDPRAELVADTVVLAEKGGETVGHVEPHPKTAGAVRIVLDEPKGLGRGIYAVDVKYKLDLVAAKVLVRDGAMWKLAWTAPPASAGHDGARVVYELPPAPTEPRLAGGDEASTTIVTLKRSPDRDELELVRAHVPRGETVTWAVRVDPKAFSAVTAPEMRTVATAPRSPEAPNHAPAALAALALAVLAGAAALLFRAKQGAVDAACASRGARPRSLVPVPRAIAPFAYGAALAGALGSLLWGDANAGAALVVAAMALATFRAPELESRPRGPGRWQTVGDEGILVAGAPPSLPGDALDVGAPRGRAVALALGAAVALAAFLLRAKLPGAHVSLPIAAMALVPVFLTGTRAQLPPSPQELAARLLGPTRDALARMVDLAHVDVGCIARFREGTSAFDEVRLTACPVDRTPGLQSIELAFAGASLAALPQVLVRFADGSEAAARVSHLAPGVMIVPGRTPEEKVLRLVPRVPTPAGAARLLARLLEELEERRRGAPAAPARYAGPERRAPRPLAGLPAAAPT